LLAANWDLLPQIGHVTVPLAAFLKRFIAESKKDMMIYLSMNEVHRITP